MGWFPTLCFDLKLKPWNACYWASAVTAHNVVVCLGKWIPPSGQWRNAGVYSSAVFVIYCTVGGWKHRREHRESEGQYAEVWVCVCINLIAPHRQTTWFRNCTSVRSINERELGRGETGMPWRKWSINKLLDNKLWVLIGRKAPAIFSKSRWKENWTKSTVLINLHHFL